MNMVSVNGITRHVLFCIACLMAGVWCVPALAQEYAALHYTSNDGLPSNTVYSLYRDSKGYLWIATDKGVARYNGSKFEVFTTFDGLPDNEVYFFEEDLQHRLWLGCNNGELCYFQNDTFFSARNNHALQLPVKLSHTQHIEVERDSSITFSFSVETSFFNFHKNRLKVINIPAHPGNSDHYLMARKTTNGRFLLVFNDHTLTIDSNSNVLSTKDNDFHLDRFTSCQSQTYLYGSGYFAALDFSHKFPMPKLALKNNYLIEIYGDGRNFFFASGNGLIVNDSIRLFEGQKVSAITCDVYDNYWVSTLNNGIYCISNRGLDLKTWSNVYPGSTTYTFSDNRQVFFTTDQNELFRVSADTLEKIVAKEHLAAHISPGLFQSAFFIDSNYHYYNFYEHTIVDIPDLRTMHPRIHISNCRSLGSGCKAIFLVDNKFYVKKYRYIDILSTNPVSLTNSVYDPNSEKIFGIEQDAHGTLWYSTISSVFKLEHEKPVLQTQLRDHFLRSFVFILGYMVAITHNNELLVINNPDAKPVIDTIPKQQSIWESIYKIDSSHAIVSTNNSYILLTLARSQQKPACNVRTLENAFLPLQAEAVTACGKTIYFFGNGSVTAIDADKLLYKPGPPQLFFTRIQTNERAYPIDSVVTIPYSESKSLRIRFSRLSFGKMRSFLQYAVSKNGQYTWTDFNAEELNLAHPGYGDYVIMIRARTFSGDYSAPVTFTLRILRPVWAQWWFIALVVCAVFLLLTALVMFTRRKALRATQRKNLQMELELKAIYAQINPHFIFNTLNTALLLVRKKRLDDAYTHISQFSRLLRSYMKSSRNKLISITDEIGNLTDYLELQKARFADKFVFTIFVDQTIDPYSVKIPSLLLQPFVENALTHGLLTSKHPGWLNIEFVPGQGQREIICRIDDNGIGRAAARSVNKGIEDKDDSYGNLLIRDLVSIFNKYEQMNIEINYIDKEEPATGTTVLISIKRPQYE